MSGPSDEVRAWETRVPSTCLCKRSQSGNTRMGQSLMPSQTIILWSEDGISFRFVRWRGYHSLQKRVKSAIRLDKVNDAKVSGCSTLACSHPSLEKVSSSVRRIKNWNWSFLLIDVRVYPFVRYFGIICSCQCAIQPQTCGLYWVNNLGTFSYWRCGWNLTRG